MKAKEREEARRLRSEEGLSVGIIAKRLGVSKGSASSWLRDVVLTTDQQLKLAMRGRLSGRQLNGSKRVMELAKEQREGFQRMGRELIKCGADTAYHTLCALYWAEGAKSRTSASMANTDVAMLKIFVSGMRKYYKCADADFTVSVMAHLNNGITVDKIHEYWLQSLGLPASCLRKFILKSKYYPVQNKKHKKHVYGCCTVNVHSVEIVQSIYGAIQELFGIDRPEWLWG